MWHFQLITNLTLIMLITHNVATANLIHTFRLTWRQMEEVDNRLCADGSNSSADHLRLEVAAMAIFVCSWGDLGPCIIIAMLSA